MYDMEKEKEIEQEIIDLQNEARYYFKKYEEVIKKCRALEYEQQRKWVVS